MIPVPTMSSRLLRSIAAVAVLLLSPLSGIAHAEAPSARTDVATRCSALAGLSLPHTTIASANLVEDPVATFKSPSLADLPAFCRVVAHVRQAPDSDIGVEIWLPVDGWTGVFHGNGNGGFAGVLAGGYGSMLSGIRQHFTTATTDTGTAPATPLEGDALIGHPQKWKDWGRRSTHVMTVTGKRIARAYYGAAIRRSYYTGCSTGGQQGLIEALYYPSDYDGILVGAPVINRTWGHAAVAWDFAAAHRSSASFLSDDKLRLLNAASTTYCNGHGFGFAGEAFISDPLACPFDPKQIACTGQSASASCLTQAEVATARAFYSGPSSRDGRPLFFGWPGGSEAPARFGWSFLETPDNGGPPFGGLFKWVFGANWDWRSLDIDHDMPIVDAKLAGDVNDATRGSLSAFAARGGKLIIFHGLADALVPPAQSVAFYQRHARQMGGIARLKRNARLFMVPGVMHCGGGPGPDSFSSTLAGIPQPPSNDPRHDLFAALIAWTNDRRSPDSVIATKFTSGTPPSVVFQRPVCAYPQTARYKGRGAMSDAASFTCSLQGRRGSRR